MEAGIILHRPLFCVPAEMEAAVQAAAEPHTLHPRPPVYLWNGFLSCCY